MSVVDQPDLRAEHRSHPEEICAEMKAQSETYEGRAGLHRRQVVATDAVTMRTSILNADASSYLVSSSKSSP
jgi:hypothetical protein